MAEAAKKDTPPAAQAANDGLQKLERELTAQKGAAPAEPSKASQRMAGVLARGDAFKNRARGFSRDLPQIALGLLSKDRGTRTMSILFWFSVAALVAVTWAGMTRSARLRRAVSVARLEKLAERHAKDEQEESARVARQESLLNVGVFSVELRPTSPVTGTSRVFNMAEIEVVLECDTPETKAYLEGHNEQLRDQLTSALVAIDKDSLTTREGKKHLKAVIIKRVNGWLKHGKVKEVFFARLIFA